MVLYNGLNVMNGNQLSSKRVVDYQKLAKLLGIEQEKLKQAGQEPKWRRVEVLRELRALDANAFDHWG